MWGHNYYLFGASILATVISIKTLYSATVGISQMNKVWIYLNSAALAYIIGFFLLFLVRKCTYLLRAWRFPKAYLRAQNIIK